MTHDQMVREAKRLADAYHTARSNNLPEMQIKFHLAKYKAFIRKIGFEPRF